MTHVNEFRAGCQTSTQNVEQNLGNIDLPNKNNEMVSDIGPSD